MTEVLVEVDFPEGVVMDVFPADSLTEAEAEQWESIEGTRILGPYTLNDPTERSVYDYIQQKVEEA